MQAPTTFLPVDDQLTALEVNKDTAETHIWSW